MLTFKQLYDSTMKFIKTMKARNRTIEDVKGQLVDIIPNPYAKTITFRFRVKSSTHITEGYNTWLQFYNIEYSDHPLSSKSVKIIEKDTGKPLYFEKISLTDSKRKNYVRVRCGCQDFRFRFAWEDRANKCLYGGVPKSYTRKPGSTRPPVNPAHIPGMCKHVFQCALSVQRYFSR